MTGPAAAADAARGFLSRVASAARERRWTAAVIRWLRAAARTLRRRKRKGVLREVEKYVRPGPHFEEWREYLTAGRQPQAKVIAFYLPQFHAIPENDEWWGKGFTEWTNLPRGLPRCRGHYQPRIPRDLGFYDLTTPGAMRRQVELARRSGVHGFCFYYYWFNRKRMLEKPLEQFVRDDGLDFPFCLMWANENWTRRWDGKEHEILLRQDYSPEDDESLIADLAEHFRHPRYIKLGGRPLFIIYRPDHVPDARERIQIWRDLWRRKHGIEPLFFMAQTFKKYDPAEFGLDGAVEFPPHWVPARCKKLTRRDIELFDPGFSGEFYRYSDVVATSLTQPPASYPLFRTVVPSWDNEARRQGTGLSLIESTPQLYETWLRGAIAYARSHPVEGEALVFVNAWNEWAEGAYLEPDVHFGAAYLNATARAVYDLPSDATREKLLLVGHDGHPFGAQTLLLSLARTFREQFGLSPVVVLLEGGPVVPEYQSICRTIVAPKGEAERDALFRGLALDGYRRAILNTTVTGVLAPHLARAGITFISLIHEMPKLVTRRRLESRAQEIARHAMAAVFAHERVRDGFLEVAGELPARSVIRVQGSYNPSVPRPGARVALRRKLGIGDSTRVVVNVGYGDLRKGFDLFVATARRVVPERDDVHFLWLGSVDPEVGHWLMPMPDDPVLKGRFHHEPYTADPQAVMDVLGGADLFFLSSREDPFPTVVMEAYAAGLDILAFAESGGHTDFVRVHGRILEREDPASAARAIVEMLEEITPESVAEKRRVRASRVRAEFSIDSYCADLLRVLDDDHRTVSVVVPNYNHARHLRARLITIFEQSYPVFEVIVLDDASTDGSLAVIERACRDYQRKVDLHVNETNSGSPFRQWRKALALARGEFVWIAEADDVAHPEFLASIMPKLIATDATFGFTDSWQIDQDDRRLGDSYADYCDSGHPSRRFTRDFALPGPEFVRDCLVDKNTILNASSVVWRREALQRALDAVGDELDDFAIAGDWRLYAEAALAGGTVAYVARSLNGHRRHPDGVTASLDRARHLEEILRMHQFFRERLDLDEARMASMEAYEEEIAKQFGLADELDRLHALK